MIMVCVEQLNVVGGTESNLTIGKQYNVSPLPDDIVFVWFEGLTQVYEELHPMYPMEAFVTLDVWRQQQIDKLI